MRYKVLTVDDSKTVRIIVKKAFKPYDVEIFEAANGVEGLMMATKEAPDLILLDVTMPVMDGVEMLTKLKSDAALKTIPVIMLTAEGGRDNVMKIAKIGIRDYLVKPFKDDSLIEKASRVIDLKPISEGGVAKSKSILDPADIMIVDDKPAIVQQIVQGLKHTPWTARGVSAQGEAIDAISKGIPDIVIVSLSLPEEGAFSLFRILRANIKTKYTPIFALVVKTEVLQQQQAQAMGFSGIITKPIDAVDLEIKIARAMNLDTSLRYFAVEGETIVMRLPEACSNTVLAEAGTYLKPKMAEGVDAGLNKLIIDIHQVKTLHMGIIKLLVQVMTSCRELGMQFALVGTQQIISECKSFEDTRGWTFYGSLAEAKGKLAGPADLPQLATA